MHRAAALRPPGLRRRWAALRGRRAGRTLAELQRDEPAAIAAWLADPDAAPHGGESLKARLGRVAAWLEGRTGGAALLAVTHAAVVRAAVVHAIAAPAASFWRLDVRPLSLTALSRGPGGWRLQQLAALPQPGYGAS